jgi:hypothetical protein
VFVFGWDNNASGESKFSAKLSLGFFKQATHRYPV